MNRVFFDLPAVIRYDNIPIRECLMDALREVTNTPIDQQDLSWNENCSGVLINVFRNNLGRFPSNEEYDEVRSLFRQNLKNLFIEREDMFDVWPGVQNVFESIDKRKNWAYYLVSDYWEIGTRFILDSCGVHSGSLKMCTADDALSGSDAIQRILKREGNTDKNGEAFLVVSSHTSTSKHIAIDCPSLTIIDHTSLTPSDESYPRFAELFAVK